MEESRHRGRESIYVYSFNSDGTLRKLAEVPTFGDIGHEGPRHSVPSRNGNKLYVVTEHCEFSSSSPGASTKDID